MISSSPLACAILVMGSLSLGLSLAYWSPTAKGITAEFSLSDMEATMVNVSGVLVAIFGAVSMHFVVERIGQRKSAFISAVFSTLTWIALGLSWNKASIFVFRCLNGATIGFFSTICPVFICEIAPENLRGLYGYINQMALAIGFLLPTVYGFFAGWRLITFLCGIPVLIMSIFVLFVPEPQGVKVHTSFFLVFKFPKELGVAFCLMFFLQFSGINALLSNLETIIGNAGIQISVSVIAMIANISQIVATALASFLVDKLGRRFCWNMSSLGQTLAFILLFLQQKLNLPASAFMVGLFAEQIFYGMGSGPIPFLLTAELFKVEVRSSAMGLMTAVDWALSAVVMFIWPLMKASFGLGFSFLFFGIICAIAIIFGSYCISSATAKTDQQSSDEGEIETVNRRLSSAAPMANL